MASGLNAVIMFWKTLSGMNSGMYFNIMVLEKMVGITLCNSLIIMVCGNDGHCLLGTRVGGLATYLIGLDMDGRAIEANCTLETNQTLNKKITL